MGLKELESLCDNMLKTLGELAKTCERLDKRLSAGGSQVYAMEDQRKAVADSPAGRAVLAHDEAIRREQAKLDAGQAEKAKFIEAGRKAKTLCEVCADEEWPSDEQCDELLAWFTDEEMDKGDYDTVRDWLRDSGAVPGNQPNVAGNADRGFIIRMADTWLGTQDFDNLAYAIKMLGMTRIREMLRNWLCSTGSVKGGSNG